jgi:hypothetical protein
VYTKQYTIMDVILSFVNGGNLLTLDLIQWNPLNGITVNWFIRLMGSFFFKISKAHSEFIPKCVRLMVSFG